MFLEKPGETVSLFLSPFSSSFTTEVREGFLSFPFFSLLSLSYFFFSFYFFLLFLRYLFFL